MALELKGRNLGARHKYLNSLSDSMNQENVTSFEDVDLSAGDVINIVKIDFASKTRNVNYILMVLQCEDIFYVSRAIKQCPWLISNSDYENIINPKYLHEDLYPKMITKGATKLKNHIKLNLKNYQRVEQFYTYEQNEKEALEWLPHCSPDFIEFNFKKHVDYVDISLLKRLCEKTIAALEIYVISNDNNYYMKEKALQATTFLLKVDFKRYLDIVEKHLKYISIRFSSKSTEYIIKQDASRIKDNFISYCNIIHIKTFLKYLEKDKIKYFFYKLFEQKLIQHRQFIKFDDLIEFIRAMSDTDRMEIIKQVFLDKVYLIEDKIPKPLRGSIENLYTFTNSHKLSYKYDHYWYRFTSFDFAYSEILKLMTNEKSLKEIDFMIDTLIILASNSEKNRTLLVDYICKSYNDCDVYCIKKSFIEKLLKNSFRYLNHNTWKKIKNMFMDDIFNEAFETTYDENYIQLCIEFILVHEVCETDKISDFIYKRFKFNSLKSYQIKLSEDNKEKVFIFLYDTIMNKINSHLSPNKKEFLCKIELLNSALDFLVDWNKNLIDYPVILKIIRELINMNEENSWDVDFSEIYNKKKSWRKDLFTESLKMNPSAPVLVNILKHDPSLLENNTELENKLHDKKVSLQQYHKKIKVFWPDSLCNQAVSAYEDKLKNGTCDKAIIRALCTCMPKESLMQLFIQHIPKEDVINWANIEELNIQQNLAKNMHIARPQPTPEIVMEYAKGAYLPFVLPSLYSIFNNLNLSQSQKFIPMLLKGKVSLQKHGIRLAYIKLLPVDVKNILTEVLKTNQNLTIRYVVFTLTFKALCKQNNPVIIQNLWSILDQLFNDLTHEDNIAIYNLLFKVEKLPLSVQPQFFSKAYSFLTDLFASNTKYYEEMKYSFNNLINYARDNVKRLCPELLQNILLEFIDKELSNVDMNISKLELLSSFIICSDTKKSQNDKCQKILLPFLHKCFKHWDDMEDSKYIMRLSLVRFLSVFPRDFRNFFSNKDAIVPTEAFQLIEGMFKKSVDTTDYYLIFTVLQLNISFLITFESSYEEGENWEKTCSKIISQFADACKEYLKDHCCRYFENIYVLFEKALNIIFERYFTKTMIFEFLQYILHGETFTPLYLMVLKLIPYHSNDTRPVAKYVKELLATISSHGSAEVQIHYYQCCNVHLKNISAAILYD